MFGFFDESGQESPYVKEEDCIVGAIVLSPTTRRIELVARRARKRTISSKTHELKASKSNPQDVQQLLQDLTRQDVEIIILVGDKSHLRRKNVNYDSDELYLQLTTAAVRECLKRYPRLEICLHRKYTNARKRAWLERGIREGVADIPHEVLIIYQKEATVATALVAADFVAWGAYQGWQWGDDQYIQTIIPKIIVHDVLTLHGQKKK